MAAASLHSPPAWRWRPAPSAAGDTSDRAARPRSPRWPPVRRSRHPGRRKGGSRRTSVDTTRVPRDQQPRPRGRNRFHSQGWRHWPRRIRTRSRRSRRRPGIRCCSWRARNRPGTRRGPRSTSNGTTARRATRGRSPAGTQPSGTERAGAACSCCNDRPREAGRCLRRVNFTGVRGRASSGAAVPAVAGAHPAASHHTTALAESAYRATRPGAC